MEFAVAGLVIALAVKIHLLLKNTLHGGIAGLAMGAAAIGCLTAAWAVSDAVEQTEARNASRIETLCHIKASEIRVSEDFDIYLQMSYTAAGKTYPGLPIEDAKSPVLSVPKLVSNRAALEARYAVGEEMPCFYDPGKPSWIFVEERATRDATKQMKWSFLWVGLILGLLAVYEVVSQLASDKPFWSAVAARKLLMLVLIFVAIGLYHRAETAAEPVVYWVLCTLSGLVAVWLHFKEFPVADIDDETEEDRTEDDQTEDEPTAAS